MFVNDVGIGKPLKIFYCILIFSDKSKIQACKLVVNFRFASLYCNIVNFTQTSTVKVAEHHFTSQGVKYANTTAI